MVIFFFINDDEPNGLENCYQAVSDRSFDLSPTVVNLELIYFIRVFVVAVIAARVEIKVRYA